MCLTSTSESKKKDDALSDKAVYRAYTHTVNGQTETIDFRRKDVQTISLKKGETAVIDDVPDGADIIVTEAMSEKHEDEGYTLKTTQTENNEKPRISSATRSPTSAISDRLRLRKRLRERGATRATARRSP